MWQAVRGMTGTAHGAIHLCRPVFCGSGTESARKSTGLPIEKILEECEHEAEHAEQRPQVAILEGSGMEVLERGPHVVGLVNNGGERG